MAPASLRGLPDPDPIIERLRDTEFAGVIEELADRIEQHRFPLFCAEVDTGLEIDWRRDYIHGISSGTRYFRFVPYLDFARVGDHKFVWELNRHQHLVVLAQAWRLTGRDEFRLEIIRQLESWWKANPWCRGINWTSALEVAFRALSWIWVYHLAGKRLGGELRQRLAHELYRHGRYLENNLSIYFSPNTHLLGEAVALHALGTLFPDFPDAASWKRTGADLVEAQMRSQVREDGSHFEQSTYYQVYALDMFLFHATMAAVTPEYRRKLRDMSRFLHTVIGPGRTLPFLGDDDGGRFFHPYGARERFARATLASCAALTDYGGWGSREEDLHEQAVWWLGPEVKLPRAPERDSTSALFEWSGLVVMRHEGLHLIADAGPFGAGPAGHSHSDALSIVLRAGEEELLADSGTFTYVEDLKLRQWFRSSAAHNTVRVDEKDQARSVNPFRWDDRPEVQILKWVTRAAHDYLDARCRRWDGIVHRRRIVFFKTRPELIIVLDVVENGGEPHLVEQFWHPAQDAVLLGGYCFRIGSSAVLTIAGGQRVELAAGGEHGWRSRCFGERSAAMVIRSMTTGTLPCHLWAVLDFAGDPGISEMSAKGLDCTYRRGARELEVRFHEGGFTVR